MTEIWIAIAVLAIALVAVVLYVVRLNRRQLDTRRQQQEQVDKLRRELVAINSAAIGIGQRLIGVEKKLKAATGQQDSHSAASHVEEPFRQAASSAEQGMSVEELMDRYGLSEAEAKLMALINMQRIS